MTYARGWGGVVTVLRTVIFDGWVRAFLAEHPAGTVVELGTGLNTRFDRVDNGQVHWFAAVRESPGPYFFACEGVLTYLDQAPEVISRIAAAFPDALLAFDTYDGEMMRRQHQRAEKTGLLARWAWSCDDPRSLESLGLEVLEAAAVSRPPIAVRAQLPGRFRYLLPLGRRVIGDMIVVTLFRTRQP
jgi:O-methyltransferase involved in polyketide biosynthesis